MLRIVVVGLLLLASPRLEAIGNKLATIVSAASFHTSLLYSSYRYKSGCTFDVICPANGTTITVEKDLDGAIIVINDGKKTPLVLGSIPRKKKHMDAVRKALSLNNESRIELFTLNRKFECDWAGLSKLVAENKGTLAQFKYPTTDFTAPTLNVLIRAIHDLRTRDERNAAVAYVHCKAGKGRSATVVAAYLAAVLHEIDVVATPGDIECFLQSRRPQVHLGAAQKQVILDFQHALKKAGSFEKLYTEHA